jgi:NADH dehydrogenase [ubiquinone] 1 alpha subcomplex assembly factor 5
MRRQQQIQRGAGHGGDARLQAARDGEHGRAYDPKAIGSNAAARQTATMSASMIVFDRAAVRHHRDRAAASVADVADVLRDTAARLLDRLDDTTRRFGQALDVGGRGIVAPMLRARGIATVACDLSPRMAARSGGLAVAADEEWLPFAPASFDLIVANLSLHWVNDLPGALIQLRQALQPDGLLLASLPALGTLAELRTALTEAEAALTGGAAPRVSPFPDLRDLAGLLQRAGFALPVADVEDIRLLYADPMHLLRDLRAAGETNAVALRDRRTPPRALFAAALAGLPARDGRVAATLRLAIITGWAPGPGQRQPLRPGSASHSLAAAVTSDRGPTPACVVTRSISASL